MSKKKDSQNPRMAGSPEEDREDLITLIGDAGESETFEHVATVEYNDEFYLALTEPQPADEDEDEDFLLTFLKIEKDADGNDVFVAVDEDTEEAVFNLLMQQIDSLGEE